MKLLRIRASFERIEYSLPMALFNRQIYANRQRPAVKEMLPFELSCGNCCVRVNDPFDHTILDGSLHKNDSTLFSRLSAHTVCRRCGAMKRALASPMFCTCDFAVHG